MTGPQETLAEASRALQARQFERAESLVRAHLAAHADDLDGLRLLAAVTNATGRMSEAEHLLRRAITLAPGHALAHADLCSLLSCLDRAGEAISLLDRAIAGRNQPAWAYSLKAATLMAERRPDDALPVLEQLVRHVPHAPAIWVSLAEALQVVGDLDRAVHAYRQAIAIEPGFAPAWLGLSALRVVPLGQGDIAVMEAAMGRASSVLAKVQLGYALGKALGDQGDYEASFRRFEEANALRGSLTPYDADALDAFVEEATQTFTSGVFPVSPEKGDRTGTPIFIVGMPRSGSTLVEQILSCHPQIEALGELFELEEVATRIGGSVAALPSAVEDLPQSELARIGQSYLAAIRRYRRTDRGYFTDKMPANWRFAPLIRLILPNAKIIDVRRDPVPCCLSGFMTYFNRQTRFPARFTDLMRYYEACGRLMDHMHGVQPGSFHRLRYEDLVTDPHAEIRRLLAYLELDFDPACLRPHDNTRPLYTPSAQQVRRRIGKEGLRRWECYEPWVPK